MPAERLETVIPYVHYYYIDVKDLSPDIYQRYTGGTPALVQQNLHLLASRHLQEHVTIRLPLIANYNTAADRQRSQQQLEALGYTRFDCFEYYVDKRASLLR